MTEQSHILVVDDEVDILTTLEDYFTAQGFAVHKAQNGTVMREVLEAQDISLVLLDLRMPGEDGFTLCRYLREHHNVGIVMLTGSSDTMDKILGLEIGADDYVSKPFDLRELLARVKSVLRRINAVPAPAREAEAATGNSIHKFGACVLNLNDYTLTTVSGETVTLGSMEFDLLQTFVKHPNRVLSRDQLLEIAHGREWDPFDRSIDVRITRLRKKIEENPGRPTHIRTVRGAGYLFSPDGT